MKIAELLSLEIVSRGKVRERADAPEIAEIDLGNGKVEKVVVARSTTRLITLTPAVWDSLMANSEFATRYNALTETRTIKREDKARMEREKADVFRAEGRKSVVDSVEIAKMLIK